MSNYPSSTHGTVVAASAVTPTDRVRWGPIIAGLFAAMSVLALLAVLGVAIGMSSVDRNDNAREFGIGAGVYGAISALIAFFFGGWMAAHSSARVAEGNGALQGAMVWMVAIPLMLYVLGSGVGSLARTAGNVANTGVQAAGQAASAAGNAATPEQTQNAADSVRSTTQQATGQIQDTARNIREQLTPERLEDAAQKVGNTAWGTLISMLLGLGASVAGGVVGRRGHRGHHAHHVAA